MADWQPTTFLRHIETLESSSRTAIIETDAGQAYLKAINNPQGVHILACDLLGTQLAKRFGLQTFDVAILNITEDDEIPLDGNYAQQGPAFVARGEDGEPLGGPEALSKIANIDDLAKIIVFDTWTRNCDRYRPGIDRDWPRQNLDNLFLSSENAGPGQFMLKPIDFGHMITCGRELKPSISNIEIVQEERVYGFFPFFKNHVSRESIIEESKRLGSFGRENWRDLIDTLPNEWNIDDKIREALDKFFSNRAAFLASEFPRLLPPEPKQGVLDLDTEK